MSTTKSPARQTRDSIELGPSNSVFPPFSVRNLREVDYGRLRWVFELVVGPVTVECNVMADDAGQPKFVTQAAVKDAYTQSYRSTVKLDRAFRDEVFDVVAAALRGEEADTEREPESQWDRWAEDQEARLERAIDELDGAA